MTKSVLASALCAALAVSLTGCGNSTAGPDLEAGRRKSEACQACHSADGNATLDGQYPRLAGQYRDYLAHSLRQYRSGERKNAIMLGFAQGLTDAEIENLALYYSTLPNSKLVDLTGKIQGD